MSSSEFHRPNEDPQRRPAAVQTAPEELDEVAEESIVDAYDGTAELRGRPAVRRGIMGAAATAAIMVAVWVWRRRRPRSRMQRLQEAFDEAKGQFETVGGKVGKRARKQARRIVKRARAQTRHAAKRARKQARQTADQARIQAGQTAGRAREQARKTAYTAAAKAKDRLHAG